MRVFCPQSLSQLDSNGLPNKRQAHAVSIPGTDPVLLHLELGFGVLYFNTFFVSGFLF